MIDQLLDRNLLPDWLIRYGIRRRLAALLTDQAAVGCGRGGTEEEENDLPFFSSRPAA